MQGPELVCQQTVTHIADKPACAGAWLLACASVQRDILPEAGKSPNAFALNQDRP